MSVLHPQEEQEVITSQTPCNHVKTINMSLTEFEKLHESLHKLLDVIRMPRAKEGNVGGSDAEEHEVF